MSISPACPACGGQQTTAVGPGRYICSSEVEYFEYVLVDDPMARLAWGTPGFKRESARRVRTCGHEFVVEAPHGQQICTGTFDGSPCGAYAVGVCQGEECGRAVCSRHGTYLSERLLCVRCTRDVQAAQAARHAERARLASRAEAQASARLVDAACAELAEATDPAVIIGALRRFARTRLEARRRTREGGPWTDSANVEKFVRLVVPAWQRYLSSRQPDHPHEIVSLKNYKVGRRPDNASHVLARMPCWLSLFHQQQAKFTWNSDRTSWVDDAWAFTADTAYHIGDDGGHQEWYRGHSGPTLSGHFMVCTGVLPQSVVVFKRNQLFHCYAVSESRPLTGEDVIEIVLVGHSGNGNHPGHARGVQFE